MKDLTSEERLAIATSLLNDEQANRYMQICADRQKSCQRKKGAPLAIEGYLRHRFGSMNYCCTCRPIEDVYEMFAGRGIKCRFTADSFVDYMVNTLGIKTLEQVRDLVICRIDRDSHFEPGNIHLVSKTEHERARRETAERYWASRPKEERPSMYL